MKKEISPKLISLSFSILVLLFVIAFYIFAWTEPTSAPPGGNVPAPLNVGSTAQTKTGSLSLPNLYLNATGAEGNIYRINQLIGYNDIFVKGNSSETAPVYLAGNQLSVYTSGTERLRVDSAGNVAVLTGDLTVQGQSVCRADGTNCPTITSFWAASGNNIYNTNSGNVGIGTTNPARPLHISNNNWAEIQLTSDADGTPKNWHINVNPTDGSFGIVETGVAKRLTILEGGNVGIGTTNPTRKLVVNESASTWGMRVQTGAGYIDFGPANSGGAHIYTDRPQFYFNRPLNLVTNPATIKAYSTYPMRFNVGGSDRLTILSNGNVGIGTTNPSQKLDVAGNINASTIGATEYCLNPSGGCITSWPSGGGADDDWTLTDGKMYANKDYVGIGTTDPQQMLHLEGATPRIRLQDNAGGASTQDAWDIGTNIQTSGGTNWGDFGIWNQMDDTGILIENTTGNVGIGTTNPNYKLDVSGGIHATEDICTDAGGGVCLSTVSGGGGGENLAQTLAIGNTTDGHHININRESDHLYIGAGDARLNIWDNGNRFIFAPYDDGAWQWGREFGYDAGDNRWYIEGGLNMKNSKIANVSEIDPVFGIQGKKYVTYMPDSIGQKVEVVGQAQLKGDKLEIDLAKEPEGSDLWLFWKVVKQDTIIPFVSPQSDADLYAYMDGSKLVVKLRAGEKNAKFSYRLIATRLDHASDTDNLYEDQSVESYIDIDSLRK